MKKRGMKATGMMRKRMKREMQRAATVTLMGTLTLKTLPSGACVACSASPFTYSAFRDEISKCANMLARTTLQVETLRAIIEDCSDEEEGRPHNDVDQHHHDVEVGFSIAASAQPLASHGMPLDVVPESVSDDAVPAATREQEIIAALDACVHEMAALDPQEKLVHCATVLQVFSPTCLLHAARSTLLHAL
jgi:hypothetical protein